MFKDKLEMFIVKRVLVLFLLLAVLDIFLIVQRWLVLGGLIAGIVFSLLSFRSTATLMENVFYQKNCSTESGKYTINYVKYFGIKFSTILLLYASLKYNIWFFAGLTAGMLHVPAVIMINGITEAIGITHNNLK